MLCLCLCLCLWLCPWLYLCICLGLSLCYDVCVCVCSCELKRPANRRLAWQRRIDLLTKSLGDNTRGWKRRRKNHQKQHTWTYTHAYRIGLPAAVANSFSILHLRPVQCNIGLDLNRMQRQTNWNGTKFGQFLQPTKQLTNNTRSHLLVWAGR